MTALEFLKTKGILKGTFYAVDENGKKEQTFYVKDVAALMDEYLVCFMSDAVRKRKESEQNETNHQNTKR